LDLGGRARTTIQCVCTVDDLAHGGVRIDQPPILTTVGGTVRVFAQQPQSQFAREITLGAE
jgi:hypothetical protein